MQKNIDLLRRNTLENALAGCQMKEHFFLLAKMTRKATESVVFSFNTSFKHDGQELFRKPEGGATLEPEIPFVVENVCFGSSEEMLR